MVLDSGNAALCVLHGGQFLPAEVVTDGVRHLAQHDQLTEAQHDQLTERAQGNVLAGVYGFAAVLV